MHTDDLHTIAELAIAMAGFAGIIYAVAKPETQQDIHQWRIKSLLTLSFSIMLAALIPLGFSEIGIPELLWWRAASGVLLVLGLTVHLNNVPQYFRMKTPSRSHIGKRNAQVVLPVILINALLQLANTFGVFGEYDYGVFYYGLVVMLIASTSQFVVSIIDRDPESA